MDDDSSIISLSLMSTITIPSTSTLIQSKPLINYHCILIPKKTYKYIHIALDNCSKAVSFSSARTPFKPSPLNPCTVPIKLHVC